MKRLLALAWLACAPFALAQQSTDSTLQLLQKLSDAPGPPGAEEPVRAVMVPGNEAACRQADL